MTHIPLVSDSTSVHPVSRAEVLRTGLEPEFGGVLPEHHRQIGAGTRIGRVTPAKRGLCG